MNKNRVTLVTGLGYVIEYGFVSSKFNLPPGKHDFPYNSMVIEVGTQEALDAIEIAPEPARLTAFITSETRELAVQSLIDKGIIDADENIL